MESWLWERHRGDRERGEGLHSRAGERWRGPRRWQWRWGWGLKVEVSGLADGLGLGAERE